MSVVEVEWGSRPGTRRRAKSGARHAPTASCKKERKSCNNIRDRSMYLCTIKTNGAPFRASTHLHPQTHNEALFSSPHLSSLRRRRVAVARPSGPNRRSRRASRHPLRPSDDSPQAGGIALRHRVCKAQGPLPRPRPHAKQRDHHRPRTPARRLLQPRREFCQQPLGRCQLQRRRHRRPTDQTPRARRHLRADAGRKRPHDAQPRPALRPELRARHVDGEHPGEQRRLEREKRL